MPVSKLMQSLFGLCQQRAFQVFKAYTQLHDPIDAFIFRLAKSSTVQTGSVDSRSVTRVKTVTYGNIILKAQSRSFELAQNHAEVYKKFSNTDGTAYGRKELSRFSWQ